MDRLTGEGVLEWVQEAFDKFPDSIAVDCGTAQTTYSELRRRTDETGARLAANGLTPGSVVAVVMDDPLAAIAAVLAIFRAGCVFAPLDGLMPIERLRAVADGLIPDAYLVDPENADFAAQLQNAAATSAKLIRTDDPLPDGAPPPHGRVDPEMLRYVCHLPTLTGLPKGVAGRLKSLSHYIKWEIEQFQIPSGCRTNLFSPLTSDLLLRDILLPLCVGGTICVPPARPRQLSPKLLRDWLEQAQLNVLHCATGTFVKLSGCELDPVRMQSLTHVFVSGAAMPVEAARKWWAAFQGRVNLIGLYGPPECTLSKFCHVISEADLVQDNIPIGRPIRGAKALIMDDSGKAALPGRVGEICLRSPYLALGYYRNLDATQEAFIKNPFSSDPADIICRTGDLGRVEEDGNYHWLGRKDHQVELDGVRIDLDEVELHVRQHPLVKNGAVLPHSDSLGRQRLVAYIVPKEKSAAPKLGDLRQALSAKLPDYMMPESAVIVADLPRTAAGTLDRSALPAPKDAGLPADEMPRTPVEEALAEIWCSVLKVPQVGRNENFFEAGGHSLLATQVISRIRERFQIELPVRTLFETRTLAELAVAIVQQQAENTEISEMTRLLAEIETATDPAGAKDVPRVQEARHE